ncbi:hypothetical protein HID58_085498, partial [Brassica napus]
MWSDDRRLSASPPSSLVFAVRGTMETHHGGRRSRGRLSRSSRRLLGLRSYSPLEERWKPITDDHSVCPQDVFFVGLSDVAHDLFNFEINYPMSKEIEEASNDDNSVVSLQPATMEKLKLFRGDTILIK